MKITINIFFCVLAILLVIGAPNKYDYNYCAVLLLLFLVNSIYYFLSNRSATGNATNFDFFFIFSYGLTNFIYPVFYKPYDPNYSLFNLPFNHNIITKATAIAYLGFAFFVLGISVYKKTQFSKRVKEPLPSFRINDIFIRLIFIVAILSFIGYFLTGGLEELQRVYSGQGGDLNTVGVYSYFNNVFVICANLLAIFVFQIKNITMKLTTFGFIGFCSLLMLTTGSRTLVLGLGLIILASYGRYIKRITMPRLLVMLVVGSIFMSFIQLSRSQDFNSGGWVKNAEKNVEFNSPFDIFNDLVINNRNLYVLVDFADKVQNVYFLSTISEITAPFPGLFNYVSESMGVPKELIFGGALPTYLEFGSGSDWGLGTNLVGETYVGFSYYGTCIIMFLLGLIVKLTGRASRQNIYAFVAYYLLVSHAVFFPRAFYLVITFSFCPSKIDQFALYKEKNFSRINQHVIFDRI